jgi:hypothetical protein
LVGEAFCRVTWAECFGSQILSKQRKLIELVISLSSDSWLKSDRRATFKKEAPALEPIILFGNKRCLVLVEPTIRSCQKASSSEHHSLILNRPYRRWFMQWYWDAFDNEIHRSLVDIVSSTQLSINEAERVPLSAGTNGTLQRNGERSSADEWRALMNHGLGLERPSTFAMRGLGLGDRPLVERKERNEDGFGGQSGSTSGIAARGLASGSGVLPGRDGGNGNAIEGRAEWKETDRSLTRSSGFSNGALVERKDEHGNAMGGQSGTTNGSLIRSSGFLSGTWKKGDGNGIERHSGLSNKYLDLLSRIPAPTGATSALATGAAAGPQVRTYFGTAGKSEIQEGPTFGQGRSRQLPPIASRLGTGQREEGGVKADTLGRWDYLQREKLLRGPLGRKASGEVEENREFTEAIVKEPVRSEDGQIATLSGGYGVRAHVRRSLDLGQGLRSADAEATRPRSSSGNEERHGGSQRSAFESLLKRSESIKSARLGFYQGED